MGVAVATHSSAGKMRCKLCYTSLSFPYSRFYKKTKCNGNDMIPDIVKYSVGGNPGSILYPMLVSKLEAWFCFRFHDSS